MQNRVHPKSWTYDNIAAMRGAAEDDGAVARLEPRVRDLRPGLLRASSRSCSSTSSPPASPTARKSKVNWDPVDQTVLANEQVIDGRGWRSGAPVEQRELTQWFFRITAYSDDLLAALDRLDRWPEKVRLMQRNWIGRSEGLRVRFALRPARRRPASTRSRSSPPATTRCSARASSPSRRTIRLPAALAGARPGARRVHRRVPPQPAPAPRRSRRPRRRASTPASRVVHPFRPDGDAARLRRQFRADGLRHRRDLRLPGARPARPRFRPEIRPAGACRWCCPPAPIPTPSRSAARPMSATARSSIPTSSTA